MITLRSLRDNQQACAFPGRPFALLVLAITCSAASAHGGGLNSEGCHNNRKTGDYHCHGAPASPPPIRAVAPEVQEETPKARKDLQPAQPIGRPACYTGPRGGTYTISRSGKKNYGGC